MTRAPKAERRLRHELVEYERAVERATAATPRSRSSMPGVFRLQRGREGHGWIDGHQAPQHRAIIKPRRADSACGTRRVVKVWPGLTRRLPPRRRCYPTPEDCPHPAAGGGRRREAAAADGCRAVEPERPMAHSKSTARVAGSSSAAARQLSPPWLKPPDTLADVKTSRADILGEGGVASADVVAVVGLCGYIDRVWATTQAEAGGLDVIANGFFFMHCAAAGGGGSLVLERPMGVLNFTGTAGPPSWLRSAWPWPLSSRRARGRRWPGRSLPAFWAQRSSASARSPPACASKPPSRRSSAPKKPAPWQKATDKLRTAVHRLARRAGRFLVQHGRPHHQGGF